MATKTKSAPAIPGVRALRISIKGTRPLLVHNVQLANPLNTYVQQMKPLTSKQKKTEDDYRNLADIEWEGGLYIEDGKIVIPNKVFKAAVISGGKKNKKGTAIRSALFVRGSAIIQHDGPKSIDKLKADPRFRLTTMVGVQRNKVLRTRPRFPSWAATFEVEFDEDEINMLDLETALTFAGKIGIGDYRPDYGRFVVESIEDI